MFSPLLASSPHPWTRVTLVRLGHLSSPPNPTYSFPSKPATTRLTFPLRRPKTCKLLASYSPPPQIPTKDHIHSLLTGSTQTITTLLALVFSLSKHFASKISLVLSLKLRPALPNPNTLAIEARQIFSAATSDSSALVSAGTPIAVIAAGLARWLEIYSCVLLIRVLLSWFPNIPWDKQPFSAIRDLCDPYLSLFRSVIPPLFNSLDVSPILAFLLLGMLGQLARPPR